MPSESHDGKEKNEKIVVHIILLLFFYLNVTADYTGARVKSPTDLRVTVITKFWSLHGKSTRINSIYHCSNKYKQITI